MMSISVNATDEELREHAHAIGLSRFNIAYLPLITVLQDGPDTAEIRFGDSPILHEAPVRRFKQRLL